MEIPDDLKTLYKHWERHTEERYSNSKIDLDQTVFEQMYLFISKRMRVWEKKQTNVLLPYTTDPILSKYRFCNIYRELDRQTIEIHTLLKHLEQDFDLWLLNVIFCRMVCRPETVRQVGFLSYDAEQNKRVFEKLVNLPRPRYGAAYIFPISLLKVIELNTREKFFCFYLPQVVEKCAKAITTLTQAPVSEALSVVLQSFGLNFKFHLTEVLIDVAYQYPEYVDLYGHFPVGPGSIPTMKRLNKAKSPEDTCLALTATRPVNFPYLTLNGKNIWLSAENWEGIGCEFRKYSNLALGNGRKRRYSA